ncbi:MAG: hypothetical protein LBE91_07665 [Tannerella sp.]|nr:hypothetical protein [Tannerella sp.]
MKQHILYILLLTLVASCSNGKKETNMKETYSNKDSVQVERFNYEATKGGTEGVLFKQGEWLVVIEVIPKYQEEFAPAKDFYMISKNFYDNGFIKARGKRLGDLPYGIWEYFDETGHPVKTVDEDAKFGKVQPGDVVKFMEKQGIFNRETGESIFFDKPLPTDGTFYREVALKLFIGLVGKKDMLPKNTEAKKMRARLKMEKYDNEQKFIPVWFVTYIIGTEGTTYFIDGNDVNNFYIEKFPYHVII